MPTADPSGAPAAARLRRVHVFVNAAAGSVDEADTVRSGLVDAFAAAGVDAVVEAIEPHRLAAAMRAAWQSAPDAIVVAGGDGTVSAAAAVAVQDDIVLGVLPLGTFNHFAKDLEMPTELGSAVTWLAGARPCAVDVGEVNGEIFVNNASIGVYPQMVADRDEIRDRRGWGKIRAVPVAVLGSLRRMPVQRLLLALDGLPATQVTTPFCFVGNGLYDDHGNDLGRRGSVTDGRLGVYVIETSSRWRLLVNAIAGRVRGLGAAEETSRHAPREMTVDAGARVLSIALDGEPMELATPLHFRSRPGALRVLIGEPSLPGSGTADGASATG